MEFSALHEHLDGGLRAKTIIDIATSKNIDLPLDDEKDLENWFYENISTEKNQVFKKFEMTISVMQDTDAIHRVAYEAIEDLVLDGVLYGELRYAPLQHLKEKLSPQQVVDAVSQGVRDGEKDFGGEFHTILCAMRQHQNSTEVAKLAIDNFNNKVIGFDLAGPEYNFPPSLHKDACNLISESDIGLTIHAGEAADLSYIEDAVFNCQAQRIGHGWQIIEGCEFKNGQYIPNSNIAQHVLDQTHQDLKILRCLGRLCSFHCNPTLAIGYCHRTLLLLLPGSVGRWISGRLYVQHSSIYHPTLASYRERFSAATRVRSVRISED